MIKVFASGDEPATVGEDLTNKFESWYNRLTNKIEILQIHSNSNKYGWMLIIHYKIIS